METAELQSPDSEQKPVSSPMDGRRQSVESNKTNDFEPASPPANCIKIDEANPNEEGTEAKDLDPTSSQKNVGELSISEETDNLESASPKQLADEDISEEIETSNDHKLSIPSEDLCQNDEIEISSDEEPTVSSEDVCQNNVPTEDTCENDVPPENVCENDEIEISDDEEPEAPPEDVCQSEEIEISSDEEPSVPPEDVSQNDEIEMPGDQESVSPPKDVRQDNEEIVNEQNIPTNDQEHPCLSKDDEQDSNEVTSPKPSETSSSDEDEEAEKQLTIVDDDVDEQMDETEQSTVQEPESKVQEPESIVQEQEEMQIDTDHTEEHPGVQLTNDEHHESKDLEKDVPVIVQTPVLKLNGNHSMSLNDEDSCSSSSSASSHNLVIDHPLAEEQPPPVNSSALEKENSLPPDVHKTNEPKSLKRKLSLSCESDSPQFKHIHLDVSEAKSPEHEKENYDEHQGLLSVGNQLTAPWERSNDTTNFPKDESQSIKFVEGHVPPVTRFSQPIHANYREPESVILKEKPPPPYEAFQNSKGLCEDPTKLLSPQNYGQYAVFNSCIVPPVTFATEALTPEHFQNAKALPDSYTRLVPVPSSKEPSIGSDIMPPPSINESTPATETSSLGPIATSLQEPSQPIIGSYDRYTTPAGKSLPPPKLNFECFKCKSVVFESFAQLREHHKCCLLSDNNRHPPAPAPAAEPLFLAHLNEKTVALSTAPGPLEKINSLATATPPPTTTKRRFYLCSSCGTYHENWNLFLHIREIHNRHVCLYCIRLFPTAEKLSLHLEIKHDLEQNHFNSEEKLRSVSKNDGNSRFLMCCSCQHVFSEHERFSDHVCTEYIQPCSLCGQKGRHLSNCKGNPEKRPKAKRKSKAIAAGPPATSAPSTVTVPPKVICKIPKSIIPPYSTSVPTHNNNNSSNFQQMAFPVLPQPSMAAPNLEFSKQNGYTEMPFAGGHSNTKPPPSEDNYNYNSDDSTNMVIDETCSTNNYFNEMPAVNPFKALDERERQEAVQKTAEIKSTLPPDRIAEAILEPKPLIVPKIKLCVPKQFQKAVDMAISSSDSNEDEQDSDAAEQDHQQSRDISVGNATRTSSTDEKDSGQEDGGGGGREGGGGEQLNSKLDRILKAIEKTQCEIRRTKEKLMRTSPTIPEATIEDHSSFEESPAKPLDLPPPPDVHYEVPPTEEARPEFSPVNLIQEPEEEPIAHTSSALYAPTSEASKSPISVVVKSWNTPEHGMYSPTPPPTPTSVWPSPAYQPDDSPTVIQAVSERENIENMEKEEKECEHSTKEKTPETETDKMNSSSELDVETIHNQEDSTMDIEEKSKQTPPRSSPPLEVMDFSPATETERRIDDTTAMEVDQQPTPEKEDEDEEIEVVREHVPPADGIEVANDDIMITDLLLDRPIEKFEIIEFVRLCVKAVYTLCLYCNHARRIAVCGHSLVLHLLAQHRFAATVDSITAEELLPATIVSKLKSFLPDLEQHYFNLESYSTLPPPPGSSTATTICNERIFECFQCRFSTRMHKDLYLHNRKMHLKTAILCFMCRANFFSFSEILCHICPGAPNKATVFDIKFRCCLCEVDGIPSPFRLMVHLRKKHFACDICLEDCLVQAKLSSHVWKHKLHHLCYRCGIAYRNKMDITKHLFWKHGTESIICKRCLQKRWRHVYHFCVPPTSFTCDVCSLCFSKATYLKVHQREHTGDFRYPCTEDNCEEKFISRKLLLKHSIKHAPPPEEIKPKEEEVEQQKEEKDDKEEHATQEGLQVKEEGKEASAQKDEKPQLAESTEVKEEETKSEEKKAEVTKEVSSKRKKKRSRNKESLEDLNLIAPNLSESDSSSESDVEKPKTDELVPNVMLSPPSEEEEKDEEDKPSETAQKDTEKIMDIWENFKSFQAQQAKKDDDAGDDDDIKSFTESDYPTPILHVAMSDHDYCAMYKIRPRPPRVEVPISKIPDESLTTDDVHSDTEAKVHELMKRKQESVSPNKKKRKSTTGSHSSSSGSSSDSSSRSSCSCKTNCSCSSSSSGSGSSSSSDDSDSSTSEGRRRVLKKREERAERNRLKSESSQKMSFSENVDVGGVDEREPAVAPVVVKDKQEPIFIETDLETAESETDEEFYDEHPQKLASQMLAEKRLLLQEQMRLSPSHNFDIMENSRPSTPSLPEEMLKEKKVKLKKKKRDRKSSCKSQAIPPIKLNLSINKVEILSNEPVVVRNQTAMQVPEVDLVPPYDLIASPGVAEPPIAQQPISTPTIQNHTVKPVPFFHTRMSEGSSCSDADSSLKRSQRARRPNKFYGYTSDDENIPGTPLMIGTRTFKPQPPPQLTWRKEDLPAPSKSILLNKQPRTAKTPSGQRGQLKKRLHQKTNSLKKKQHRLPPIPTLKIRPPKPNKPPFVAVALPPPPPPVVTHHQSSYSSSRDESDDSDSSDEEMELPATNTVSAASVIPRWNSTPAPVVIEPTPAPPPPPQAPQATAFNQKIPPALLPNPDFATLQYFKRNNIRYPIAPPAGARQPREGESVYCYCRCPYDEVSEMIACDGDNCMIEWFHFECVGIMVAPQGKWFCAECRPKYSNELYPQLS